MVLASQTSRHTGHRPLTSSRSRRRRGGWRRRGVLTLAVTLAAGWWFNPLGLFRQRSAGDAATPPPLKQTSAVPVRIESAAPPAAPGATPGATPVAARAVQSPVESPKPAQKPAPATPIAPAGPSLEETPPAVAESTALAAAAPATQPEDAIATPASLKARIQSGIDLLSEGKHLEGRSQLNEVLTQSGNELASRDARELRDVLAALNKELVFGEVTLEGDPHTLRHTVASGESYALIARNHAITAKLLETVNRIPASRLPAGRAIKVIRGPFHAEVSKSDFRMDLFLESPQGPRLYVTSFPVGLGEDDSTPVGLWVIRPGGKVANPSWRSPRDGVFYDRDDPRNPIGEYWLALAGVDENTRTKQSYGIHGTNDPSSIGQQKSMGCVRMLDPDIERVYQLLVEARSTVIVRP